MGNDAVEISKYKEEALFRPIDEAMQRLPADKQLALCLMALERLYTTYFVKYDKSGAKHFAKLLDILERGLTAGEIPEEEEIDRLADWCDRCADKMEDARCSEWKRCAMELLFPDCLCQFTESLTGVCRQKNPFEYGDIYQLGVDLCELYERDFQNTTKVDFMNFHEFLATRRRDVAEAIETAVEKAKLYQQKKIPRQEYFDALDVVDNLCAAASQEDKDLYASLRRKTPESFRDMPLMAAEAERVKGDLLFLERCGELPNQELTERLSSYRTLNILKPAKGSGTHKKSNPAQKGRPL